MRQARTMANRYVLLSSIESSIKLIRCLAAAAASTEIAFARMQETNAPSHNVLPYAAIAIKMPLKVCDRYALAVRAVCAEFSL